LDGDGVADAFHPGADRGQDAAGDVDVAHVGHIADRARSVAQDGGDHVLGHRILGPSHLHLAPERSGRLDQPGIPHCSKANRRGRRRRDRSALWRAGPSSHAGTVTFILLVGPTTTPTTSPVGEITIYGGPNVTYNLPGSQSDPADFYGIIAALI